MKLFFSAALFWAVHLAVPAVADTYAEMFPQYVGEFTDQEVQEMSGLDYQQGKVVIGDAGSAIATLNITDGYYFLNAKDSNYVLSELWGNPIGEPLGMIFPKGITPHHENSWALEITFDDIGYVSDEDAARYDYAEILEVMKEDVKDENIWRDDNGYERVELIGWASEPFYDSQKQQMHWAEELRFGDEDEHTLNYNLRILGRKGVLVMNFISSINELPAVSAATPDILDMVTFTKGNAYGDFNPSIDKVAAVGIGGLIAGKVIAKTGIFVTALLFLKKFWFLLLIPIFALKNRIFGKKDDH